MSDVRIIPLGVGEAFTALHYTTCLALGVDDDWLLIECPHPIRKMLHEASTATAIPLDLDRISGVVLSHLHADHCSGVEDYAFYSHFVLGRRARLLAHSETLSSLWLSLSAGMARMRWRRDEPLVQRHLDDYFDTIELSDSTAVSFGPFTIECRPTVHSIPTTAFRIRAGGRTLGFSGDTVFDPGLIEWLSSADLIVHEATTRPDAAEVHTLYEKLAALPADLRARMRLIHYPDDFDHDASVIATLRQGHCYSV
jgi:ribonuclease BN (tRNA processing enzyme)